MNKQSFERDHVWLGVCDASNGSYAVYFGENDTRNFIGPFNWGKPVEKTRIGLAALIKAISIIKLSCLKINSLVVHVSSKYLLDAILQWCECVIKQKKPFHKSTDLFLVFSKQVINGSLKILPVLETKIEGNILVAKQNAESFKWPNVFE